MLDYRAALAAVRDAPRPEKARWFLRTYVAANTTWADLRDSIRHAAGFNGAFVRHGLDGLEDVLGGRPTDAEVLALCEAGRYPATGATEARAWLEGVARLVREELQLGPYGPEVGYGAVSTMITPDGEWVRLRCVDIVGTDDEQLVVFVREGTDELAFVGHYLPGPETVTLANEEQTARAIARWRAG